MSAYSAHSPTPQYGYQQYTGSSPYAPPQQLRGPSPQPQHFHSQQQGHGHHRPQGSPNMANAHALPGGAPQAGAITYTTSHTADGHIIYHPYKAVPATYQTPGGVVSGIQWVPSDPTPILPVGGVPAGPEFAASWARGSSEMTKEQEKQHKEWQRSEDKRRKKEEAAARGSLAHMQQRSHSTSAVPTGASYTSPYGPAPTSPYTPQPQPGGFSPEQSKRKSFVGGGQGYPNSATNIYAASGRPRSPFAPGAGQDPNAPPRSPYAAQAPVPRSPYAAAGVLSNDRPKSPFYGGAERPKSPYHGAGPAGGIYSSATAGVDRPRSPYAPPPLALGDKARTPIPGSPSGMGLGHLPQTHGSFQPYSQQYGAQTPGDLERKFGEMQPFERERRVSSSVPPNTSYAAYTPNSSAQAQLPHSRAPSGSYVPVIGPSGTYVWPKGHVMEGQIVPGMPAPPQGAPVGSSYHGAGNPNERGGMGTIMGGVPVPFPTTHGALPHSQGASPALGGGVLPGGDYTHAHGAGAGLAGLVPQLSEPEGFSRPINAAMSYPPFDPMRITLMDELASGRLPKMPAVLQVHDVYTEDWSRLVTDLALAWAGRLPTGPSVNGQPIHRATLSADLIDLWNTSFFTLRSVEMVLYRGAERRSGPPHLLGVKDIVLPEGASDDSDDSSGSDDSSDSDNGYNNDDPRFAGRKPGMYGVPGGYFANPEEERRARKKEKKREKKRLRKERRRRRKDAGKTWAVYLMYRPAGMGGNAGAVPSVHHVPGHAHAHGHERTPSQTYGGHGHQRTPSQTYGVPTLAGRKSPIPPSAGAPPSPYATAGGHSPAAQGASPFIPPSPRPASNVAPLPYGQVQQAPPQQTGAAYGSQPASVYGSGGGSQPYGSQPYGGQAYGGAAQGSQPYGSQPYGASSVSQPYGSGQGSQPYGAAVQGQGQPQAQSYPPGQAPATFSSAGSGYSGYSGTGYGKGY